MTTVMLPFVLAAAIAYLLDPWVVFFEVRGLQRRRAVMGVFALSVGVFLTASYVGVSAAIDGAARFALDMPPRLQQGTELLKIDESLKQRFPLLKSLGGNPWLREEIGKHGRAQWITISAKAPAFIASHVLSFLKLLLLVPFLTFFFMLDGPGLREGLLDCIPARYVEMFLNILAEIDYALGNYLRGIAVQAVFMGLLAGVGYSLMGLHDAVYIAIWVAITSVIPLIGPTSAAVAGALVALFQWGTLTGLLKVVAVYLAIRALDDWLLHPMILRRAMHIHPVVTVFALMAGASLAGFWGLLFGVPAVCMLKVLAEAGGRWFRSEYGL